MPKAPTTPGIFSRSSSTHRLHSQKDHSDQESIPKSKSSSHLLPPPHRPRRNHAFRPLTRREPPSSASTEWLFRAGAVLSSEARESKGQSWLISRASSTSPVSYARDDDEDQPSCYSDQADDVEDVAFADDEFSPLSTRHSRGGSRMASRGPSRIGSRVGSKFNLQEGEEGIEGYGLEYDYAQGPDFVDEISEREEKEQEEDAEVSRLMRHNGTGFLGWLDRLLDWTFFSLNDDNEDENDMEPSIHQSTETITQAEEGLSSRGTRKAEHGDTMPTHSFPSVGGAPTSSDDPPPPPTTTMIKTAEGREQRLQQREAGWNDPAWLLSVATRVVT